MFLYLGLEVPENVKVKLEVGGQDALDEEEAETLELRGLQVLEKTEFWVVGEQVPASGGMMVLKDAAVIVEDSLNMEDGAKYQECVDTCVIDKYRIGGIFRG